MNRRRFLLINLFWIALSTVPLPAADVNPRRPLQVADYLDWERVSDPQISPDGKRVVYTRQWVNKLTDRWESELWIVHADGSKNRRLGKGSGARWSPDGTRIAYLHTGEPRGTQIFVRWLDRAGGATQVTRVLETPKNLHWSPDGTRIAFTMYVEKKSDWKIAMPAPPKGAKWTEPPRIIENTHYRQDRKGFLKQGFQHLFVVTADGGTPIQLTRGNWHVGARFSGMDYGAGIDWTPDGKEIVFDGQQAADADRRYRESHIYAVDVKTKAVRQITRRKGPWSNPVVSPDGRQIAYTGYEWTKQSYKSDELYVIGRDGSGGRQISGKLDRDPRDLHWAPDGSAIYFTAWDRGSSNVYAVTPAGNVRKLTNRPQMLSLSSQSKNGVAVGVQSSFHEPGDVVRYALPKPGELKRLTRVNDDLLSQRQLGDVEELWYTSTNGARVQGWIVKPPGFDAKKKHPLILHIHGGPHSMYNVGVNFSFQHLAANGYVVLYTNPRGSTGYGTVFGNAIDNAYPSVDYDDLLAGVDAALKKGYVDPARMYATGVSGGGVLSSWIVGHTDRFAAAAVRAPVTNWISFAGTTDISAWGLHRFHKPYWEEPRRWLEHSPLMHAHKVKTPTLMICGELDLRTPIGQTEEFYQALRANKVPAALVRFHGEYHGTGSKPSNFMRTQLYLLRWFGTHRKSGAGPDPVSGSSRRQR